MKVMFVVTHLLGSGHLSRTLTLARAFAEKGHEVRVVSGGMRVPHLETTGLDMAYLPPLCSDGINFTRLLDSDGTFVGPEYIAKRAQALVSQFRDFRPDVLITELFPFGRRVLKDEFVALLDAAASMVPKPLVCASIRDILAPPSKPARADTTHALVAQFYDAILVHSDAEIIPIDKSWPITPAAAGKLYYTGFVAQKPAPLHPDAVGAGEIVVSAGGGNVGRNIFVTALQAARLDPETTWRVLVGGADARERCEELAKMAPHNAVVEPARPDFRQILHHAEVSVSMCGYNTTLDILQSGVRAVVVPFDDGGEVEQSLRAQALALLDGFEEISSDKLTAQALIKAVRKLREKPKRQPMTRGLNGAETAVEIVEKLLERQLA